MRLNDFTARPQFVASAATAVAMASALYPAVRASLLTVGADARSAGSGPFAVLTVFVGHVAIYALLAWCIGLMLTAPIWFALTRGARPYPLVPTLLVGTVTSSAVLLGGAVSTPGLAALVIAVVLGATSGAIMWLFAGSRPQS